MGVRLVTEDPTEASLSGYGKYSEDGHNNGMRFAAVPGCCVEQGCCHLGYNHSWERQGSCSNEKSFCVTHVPGLAFQFIQIV
jgi:hypothetical protein